MGPSPELPLLPSERDDSESRGSVSRETGTASADVDSSPYEGGAGAAALFRCIVDSLCKSSNPLVLPLRHLNPLRLSDL